MYLIEHVFNAWKKKKTIVMQIEKSGRICYETI